MTRNMRQEITSMSVTSLSARLKQKELTAVEAVQAYLDQIEQLDSQTGAYLTVTADSALGQAEKIDACRQNGKTLSPLAGIPMGLKDNLCTKGIPTTCASKMLESFIPPYSAAAAEALEQAGAILLGKLNMDEFAMGSTTEHSYFHVTRNPRDFSRVPGGSSGGSAAAVAAGEAAFTLGSDTGGSIRQPASFCGVVGMKPTYGMVSRYGLIAFASSLDQIGPLTRNVEDSALILSAIAGKDPRDATSCSPPHGKESLLDWKRDVSGMRAALPKEYLGKGISPEVREAVLEAAKQFERLGIQVEETSLPSLEYALPAYYVLSSAEASSNLARFDGIKYGYRASQGESLDDFYCASRSEGFGKEVKRRIMLGSFVLSAGYYDAYYKKALQIRTLIRRDFDRVFSANDFIIGPVAPTTAYQLGEKRENPLEMYLGDIYTVPVNLAGLPAVSLPCGKDPGGLPIGLQLIGKAFGEADLYRAAYAYEKSMGGILL